MNYKNIKYLLNDLNTDFKIILNAQYYVTSNSTLSLVINSLSKSKTKIYISDGWLK